VTDLRALLVAYSFPPVGGAGVQRVVKLTKYLPAHAVRPAVLTVSNPSVPLLDDSLEKDLPPGLEVVRARTLEPGYEAKQAAWKADAAHQSSGAPKSRRALANRAVRALTQVAKQLLIPDPQVLWQPAAQRALAGRLVAGKDDVVFISGPPFSQFLLAPLARLRPGVGTVLDYRDEWSTYRTTYEMMGGGLAKKIGDPLEAALLRRASFVTTATDEFRENLLARFPFLDPGRVAAIPNGYDTDDFPADLPAPPESKLTITYAGTVFKLTSARGLLGAIRRLHARSPELARHLEVRFIGRIVDTEKDSFEGMSELGVTTQGYVPHDRVLRELAASHMVLCLLDDVPGNERIYPAKIFELMVLGRPILTLAPDGALTRLVQKHQLGHLLRPRDEAAISELLERLLRAFVTKTPVANGSPQGVERYHRRALAGEFASVMREAASYAKRGRKAD